MASQEVILYYFLYLKVFYDLATDFAVLGLQPVVKQHLSMILF